LISMTGSDTSELAQAADVHLLASVETEACPLNLAPTSSTTAALVMGDALAIAILEARGFTAQEFAFSHPGGALGKRLLLRVADVMFSGSDIPTITPTAVLADAIVEMTQKGLGMTTIASDDRQLLGIFTDGDLRRAVKNGTDLRATTLTEAMTADARTIHQELLAAEAMALMERHQISALVVVDDQNTIIGIVTLLALLKAGLS
ncbi:MAG: KpsF/GutQ family sugar-phosphate isomerase, partial [Luminiphilus sp.]|nr:KpsF/GutQ family sugar-phosphate isomerase [Luminiphilus sp.]